MRTVLSFVPALICAGSMIVCVRMMSRGRRKEPPEQHPDEGTPEPRTEEHIA